jgi:spermidine synthase
MISAALILPQSILLGTTFPLMSAAVLRRFQNQPGGSLAILYFANSFGAAAGVLLAGFFLIAFVGLPGTLFIASVINILVAVAAFLVSYSDSIQPSDAADMTSPADSADMAAPIEYPLSPNHL